MKVISHGNSFKRKVVCPVCKCEFIYEKEDVLSKDNYGGILTINYGAKFPKEDKDTDFPYYVICPECGHKIQDTITDKSGLPTPRSPEDNQFRITTTPAAIIIDHSEECDHSEVDWDYSQILTSNPPKVKGVCKKCGSVVYSTVGQLMVGGKKITLSSDRKDIQCK